MRWQRPLRYMVAVAGLGFAGLLYMRFEKKPVVLQAPLPPPLAAGVSYESAMSPGGEQVRYKNDREVSRMKWSRTVKYTDGRTVIEKPEFVADRDGKPYRVTADRGELKTPSGDTQSTDSFEEVHLTGHVVLHEQDGMEIATDDAFYQDAVAILEINGPMTFTDTRASGSAVGAVYERNQQLLTLKDQAVLHMAAEKDGSGKFDATSRSMTINRTTHFVSMDGNPTIVRERETINAETAQLHMSEDNHGVQMMELHQHASIAPTGGSKTPEMRGDDITLEFQGDGRTIKRTQMFRSASMALAAATGRQSVSGDMVDATLAADGATVTSLRVPGNAKVSMPMTKDAPQRDITAKEMTGRGDEKKGLTDVVFTQNVVFLETRPASKTEHELRRKVTAAQLALALEGGDLSDIKDATFKGDVEFIDGVKYGEGADTMVYRAKAGRLELRKTGNTGRKQKVQTDKIIVFARVIDLDLEKTAISANTELSTETVPDPSAKKSGLFDEHKVTRGFAKSLTYDGDLGKATYVGPARLWQGEGKDRSQIDATTQIVIDDKKGDISAEGKVATVFSIQNLQAGTSGSSTTKAQKFSYIDGERKAHYEGTLADRVALDGPDGKFYAVTIDLWLSDDGSELRRMLMNGDVQARVSPERTVLARHTATSGRNAVEQMEYDAKAGTYKMIGSPTKVIERQVDKAVESCTVTLGATMSFTKSQNLKAPGSWTWSDPVGVGSSSFRAANCTEWVIK